MGCGTSSEASPPAILEKGVLLDETTEPKEISIEKEPNTDIDTGTVISLFDKAEEIELKGDWKEAIKLYNTIANDTNNPNQIDAIVKQGIAHLYGMNCVRINYSKAFELFTIATELFKSSSSKDESNKQPYHVSFSWLGFCYAGGIAVQVQEDIAISMCSNPNCSLALSTKAALLMMHEDSTEEVTELLKQSEKILRKQSDEGVAWAQSFLSMCIIREMMNNTVENEHIILASKAAAAGHAYAQYSLGLFVYTEEMKRIEADTYEKFNQKLLKDIMFNYELAAKQGQPDAAAALSKIYSEDDLIDRDDQIAVDYLKIAAEQQDLDSMVELAKAQISGLEYEPIVKNYPSAFKLLSLTAERKYPEGMYILGTLYAAGFGVDKDEKKAQELFSEANSLGY